MSFARAQRRRDAREAARPPRPEVIQGPGVGEAARGRKTKLRSDRAWSSSSRYRGRRLTTTVPNGHLATPRRVRRFLGLA